MKIFNFPKHSRRIAALIIGIIFGILGSELLLRMYYWAAEQTLFGLAPARTTIRWQDDSLIGRKLLPSQHGWFVTESNEYFTWITINSFGWRDSQHQRQKPANTLRVVVIGDSFVENFQVPLEQTFFKKLEAALIKLVGQEVEVIALGLGDSGTTQQYLVLKNFGIDWQPDIIVHLFFSGNDVKNNSPILTQDPHRPYFRLKGDKISLQPFTVRSKLLKYKIVSFFKNNLRVAELLLDAKGKFLTGAKSYAVDYQVYNQEYSSAYQEAWEVTKRTILASRQTAENAGAKYILVSIGSNEQIHPDTWQVLAQKYPTLRDADPDKPDKILQDFCNQTTTNCAFMTPYFRQALATYGRRTHFLRDGHWTDFGTSVAATFLENLLIPYVVQK